MTQRRDAKADRNGSDDRNAEFNQHCTCSLC
jgi:hypothetical protein